MKICTKCNLSYDDDKKFCKDCGDLLTLKQQIDKKKILKDIKRVFGSLLIILGLVFFIRYGYNLFRLLVQPEKLIEETMQQFINQGKDQREIDSYLRMMRESVNIMRIFNAVYSLIGAGIAYVGYMLYRKKKQRVKIPTVF